MTLIARLLSQNSSLSHGFSRLPPERGPHGTPVNQQRRRPPCSHGLVHLHLHRIRCVALHSIESRTSLDLMLAPQAHDLRGGTKETIARQPAVIWEWKCRDSVSLDVSSFKKSNGYSQTHMLLCMPSCVGWSCARVRSKVTPPSPSQIALLSS